MKSGALEVLKLAFMDWLSRRSSKTVPDRANTPQPTPEPSEQTRAPTRAGLTHAKDVPTGDFRFIALDVETACRDSASICQIGLACVQANNEIQTFSMLVNPETQFDAFNIQLHGIGPEHVVGAACFPDALAAILPLLAEHRLVQHSSFDKRAMTAACELYGITQPNLIWSDSVTIARRAWPELKGNGGHGLASLKRVLGLEFQHHDAGEDARAAAMVVLHAETQLEMTIEELAMPTPKKRYPSKVTREPNPDGPFFGAVAVFTGNIGMTRVDAADLAAKLGMAVRASVTTKTTHLIVGEQDQAVLAGQSKSTKHRKAEEMQDLGHPLQIIGETDFQTFLCDEG